MPVMSTRVGLEGPRCQGREGYGMAGTLHWRNHSDHYPKKITPTSGLQFQEGSENMEFMSLVGKAVQGGRESTFHISHGRDAESIYGMAKSHPESPWSLRGQAGGWLYTPGGWSQGYQIGPQFLYELCGVT